MLKKDVLKILTAKEIALTIERDPAQVTRMPPKVPENHQRAIYSECRRKAGIVSRALDRIRGAMK